MDSIKDEILIQKALSNELTNEELTEFEQKLKQNKEFKDKVNDYVELVSILKASNRVINEKEKLVVFRRLSVAASLILIIGISVIVTKNRMNQIELSKQYVKSQIFEEYSNLLQTDEFLPNQILENNLNVRYRNTDAIPVMLTPTDSAIFEKYEEFVFEFDNSKKLRYNIQFYNNQLQKMYQTPEINDSKFSFRNELPVGLYYIKIQTSEASVWINRIFIVLPPDSITN